MVDERLIPTEWSKSTVLDPENVRPQIVSLVDALRTELTDYGGMLVLLEEQQHFIEMRSPTALIANVAALRQQMEIVAANRKRRNERTERLLTTLQLEPGSSFNDLIATVPEEYQPLLKALIDEINDLLFRCQQRVLLNNLLLTSSGTRLAAADLTMSLQE